MTAINTIQGQSSATIDKERCIGSALAIGMSIANAKFKGFRYWHFDANSGSGWNHAAGVAGSPLVFHSVANERLTCMRREAFFCDMNSSSITALSEKLEKLNCENSYCLLGDNEDALLVFEERIRSTERNPAFAVGSVIADPNGYWFRNAKGEGAPVRALTQFTSKFPKIDVILNLNARTYKLQRAQGHDVMPPRDVFASLNKAHWLVRRTQCGGDQFLLAVGRNVATGDHKALGFHDVMSEAGRHIMSLIEGSRQGGLFDEAV